MNLFTEKIGFLIKEFERVHACIRVAYLFGSQAKGNASVDSDVDVAVLLRDDADPLVDLVLGDYLSQSLGKPVDVVVLNYASPILQHEVIRNGIRLQENSPMVRRFYELRAFRNYIDAVFYQQKKRMKVAHG